MAYLAALLTWLCLTAAVWSWKRAMKDGDVILGGLFDIHSNTDPSVDCGKIFPASLGLAEAMVYAVEKVNSDAALLPNVTLGYDIRDYCYRSDMAMEISYDFVRAGDSKCQQGNTSQSNISKPVIAVVGPPDSQSSLLVTTLFGVRDIPVISPVATSDELSTLLYDNFYRTVPSDKWQTTAMADMVEYFNWTYVGLVALDDSYGQNAASAIQKEASSRGTFCLAFTEIIPRLDYLSKLERVVKRLKESKNANVVLVWLYGGFGKRFFQEVSKNKILGYTWILSDGVIGWDVEDIFNGPSINVLDGSLAIQPHGNFDKGFEKHLKEINRHKLLQENQLPWWDEFWRLEFNCSIEVDRQQTSTCPFNLSSTSSARKLNCVYIPYCLDAVYALAYAVDKIYRDEAQSAKTTFSVKEKYLGQYLKLLSFDGLTGNVRFDRFGDPVEATYDIMNIRKAKENPGDPFVVWVGNWSNRGNQGLSIGSARIRWNPNVDMVSSLPTSVCSEPCLPGTRKSLSTPRCCWKCIRCPDGTTSSQVGSTNCTECGKEEKSNAARTKCKPLPLVSATLSSPSGLAVVAVSVSGIFLILWFGLVIIKYYQSPVVKGSNRELSLFLLVAITAKIANAMLNMQKPSDLWCRITLPCRYLLCNVCVSVLLLKSLRLSIVFQTMMPTMQFQRWILESRKQAIPLFLLQATEVVLTILWLCTDPPHQTTLVSPRSHVSLVCKHFASWPGLVLVILIGVYLVTLCIICTAYAFKARKIPENFNEAKYIGFSMYIILLTVVLSLPVAFVMDGWYVTVINSAATLTISFALLGFMFGPKIYVMLVHPEQNTVQAVRTQVAHFSFQSSNLAGNKVGTAPPVSQNSHMT